MDIGRCRQYNTFRNVDADSLIISSSKLPELISPYSFLATIKKCAEYSLRAFKNGRSCDVEDPANTPLPWELNTFAALSAIYANGPIGEMPDYIFRLVIKTIKSFIPTCVYDQSLSDGEIKVQDLLACEFSSIQFQYQQDLLVLLFRYKFLYTYIDESLNINMPELFRAKFGIDGDDLFLFLVMAHFAMLQGKYWLHFIRDFSNEYNIIPNELFVKIMDMFATDRDEFATRQLMLFELSTDGYFNAINLLEERPFIKMGDKSFLPLPYLLHIAAARNLFDRLMAPNDESRAKIGGPLMEKYVYELLVRSSCYDSVCREFKYRVGRSERLSPDIMVQSLGTYVFFEVKLSEAPIAIRQMPPGMVEKLRMAYANWIYQLFSRIKELCAGVARHMANPAREGTYGVVVVHEDAYLLRDDIYEECFNMHPKLSEDDKEFIRRRISLTGLYTIEQYCHSKTNIIAGLKLRETDRKYHISFDLHANEICKNELKLPIDEYKNLIQCLPIRLFTAMC